jgi:DNA-binding NtrC family response regulator
MSLRVCLIEDDPLMGETLAERLRLEGMECLWLQTGAEALQLDPATPLDAMVSDVRLPDVEGPELMQRMAAPLRHLPWIFITGFGTVAQRDSLIASGALDFFTKPLDMDRLIRRLRSLRPEPAQPARETAAPVCPMGVSGEMRRLHAMLARLGGHWDSVLITGESGSGKEELARCLHRETLGEDVPFVAVNAASLPESLIEAELFGHEKGAFTGAMRQHRGKFEQAHGGTLFFDEIGDMPLTLQTRLLRVLQDRMVTRLGGEQPINVRVRLIFATHKRLNEEVRAGRFREDLYYRINVVHLHVPPLRERPEDVLWLAQRFARDWNVAHPQAARRLDAAAEQALMRHAWPGNVRELRNAIERACLLSEGEVIEPPLLLMEDGVTASDVGEQPVQASETESMPRLEEYLRLHEREFILHALQRHDWQISVTADALGISRKNLWERMKRLAIQ